MKMILTTLLATFISLSALAQSLVTAEKSNELADLCFYKQVQITGYAYVNLVGRCAWDPAMNGMTLSLIAVSEDPMQSAQKIDLGYIRNISLVKNQSKQLQISITVDEFNANGDAIQKSRVIYVRGVDPQKGIFSVTTK